MSSFTLILEVLLGAYLLIQIWLTTAFFRYRNRILPEPEVWPEITILVAARNEEKNIGRCLDALCELDYPADKLHIVVGNDQSTDHTREITEAYCRNYPFIRLINIVEDDTGLKAKARVMAQLDKYAQGEFYLVTDADVAVKPTWAKYLIRHMKAQTGVASGTTMVAGNDLNTKMQGMDWAYFMGMLNMISWSGVPATAVGNNMIIRKEAYWQTGGYSAIRFSITEDYKLYSEVCKKGWKWDNIMIPEVLAYSDSVKGFIPLLHQRKRWLSGGRELPFYWWILFVVFGAYYFVVPVMLFLSPWIALAVIGLKFSLQWLSMNRIHSMLGEKPPGILQHLMYEVYLYAVTIGTAFFFILPFRTVWKGRQY